MAGICVNLDPLSDAVDAWEGVLAAGAASVMVGRDDGGAPVQVRAKQASRRHCLNGAVRNELVQSIILLSGRARRRPEALSLDRAPSNYSLMLTVLWTTQARGARCGCCSRTYPPTGPS